MKRFAAQSAEEIETRNQRLAEFDAQRAKRRADAGADDGGSGSDNDGSGSDAEADAEREAMLVGMRVSGMSLNDDDDKWEKKERKPKGLEGIIETENPNAVNPNKMMKIKDLKTPDPSTMTRKEREEAQKAAATAAYRRKHEMGQTEEYKRDMAKLEEVKKRREAKAAKAAEAKAEQVALEEERKKLAEAAGATEANGEKKSSKKKEKSSIPKLDKITIKKMKPARLKEALKERGLDIQGNSKALTERLLKFEAGR